MNFGKTIRLAMLVLPLTIMGDLSADTAAEQTSVNAIIDRVNQYCGTCHNVPSPSLMPKKDWPYAVKKMAEMAQEQMGKPFIPPEHIRDITAYYYGSSPESLPKLPYSFDVSHTVGFRGTAMGRKTAIPLISSIHPVDLSPGEDKEFLICDAETNEVSLLTIGKTSWKEKVLGSVNVPMRTRVVDFDKDGDNDVLVAALGLVFPPLGTYAGQVVLLRQMESGEFQKEILLENVGRIADVQAQDIDNDNDLDLAVAVFGGDAPGALGWLENLGENKFAKHSLMELSGALNITPTDLNNDGKVDFVSLISQEHEMIVAFVNRGKGKFEHTVLFKAAHPMVGSTGMKLVDLDGDKDLDIVFTNGDAHDLQFDPKPYHGVQWLENKGNMKYEFHEIARFYGAADATAGDMDGDGDVDIVVSSWNNYWEDERRQSLIWFENDGKQNFARRNILNRPKAIASVALDDITGDGRLDIIAGVFQVDALKAKVSAEKEGKPAQKQDAVNPRIVILRNRVIPKE